MFKIQASVNLLFRPGEIKLIALLSNTCILLAVIRRGYCFFFMPLAECDVSLPVPFSKPNSLFSKRQVFALPGWLQLVSN